MDIVVLDTNIWIQTSMLRSARGSALRLALHQRAAVLGIPEVLRREVIHHYSDELRQFREQADTAHRELLKRFGSLKELVLPSVGDLDAHAERCFEGLGLKTLAVPLSLAAAESALDKCVRGVPPCGPKNQQAKDALLWAACLELTKQGNVTFATDDLAFFEGKDPKKGLARNLRNEVSRFANLTLTHGYHAILESRPAVAFNEAAAISQLRELAQQGVDSLLSKQGLELDALVVVQREFFATDDPQAVYVEFNATFTCKGAADANVILRGEGMVNPLTGAVSKMQRRGEELLWVDESGNRRQSNVVLMAASIHLGHRDVFYEVREKLPY